MIYLALHLIDTKAFESGVRRSISTMTPPRRNLMVTLLNNKM